MGSRQVPRWIAAERRDSRIQAPPAFMLALCLAAALGAQAPPAARPQGAVLDAHRRCAACHSSHRPLGLPQGRRARMDGDLCENCHQATPQGAQTPEAPRLPARSAMGSTHLVDPLMPPRAGSYVRVVRRSGRPLILKNSCLGCHDAHARTPGMLRADAFDVRGRLAGRKSATAADVCFGCHAGQDAVRLDTGHSDLGACFSSTAASSHRINSAATDRPDLPSLRATAFRGRLDCISCHDNPDTSGLRGPHASRYPSLLKAPYGHEQSGARAGTQSGDLCYTCHDKFSILGNQSFPFHSQHLQGFRSGGSTGLARGLRSWGPVAPQVIGPRSPRDLLPGRIPAALATFEEPATCATCHDPHGSATNPSLIQFDPMVVTPSSVGGIRFQRTGLGRGSCTLSCHGYDHIQKRY